MNEQNEIKVINGASSIVDSLCLKYAKLFSTTRTAVNDRAASISVRQLSDFDKYLRPLSKKFPCISDLIANKKVLDYGCARGFQCVAMLCYDPIEMVGVDIQKDRIECGRELISQLGVGDRINLFTKIPDEYQGYFDVVVTLNCMEHFPNPDQSLREMRDALKPGGRLLLAFNPTWFSAYGSHQNEFTMAPWLHLLFPESSFMRTRGHLMGDFSLKSYQDRWLNKMSVRKFRNTIERSGMIIESIDYDCSLGMRWTPHIPIIRELFVSGIACVLRKPHS